MQVQFNLDLSEREREDRSKVILPFEHQGLPSFTYTRMIRTLSVIHVLDMRNSHFCTDGGMQRSRTDSCQAMSTTCYPILEHEHYWNLAGDGREAHIYDGRPDPVDSDFEKLGISRGFVNENDIQNLGSTQGAVGEIHYLRDSDDERPDSDEDPDDDLDI
jgi:hypothetical protein